MKKYKWDMGMSPFSIQETFDRFLGDLDGLFDFDFDFGENVTVANSPGTVVKITTKGESATVDVELAGWDKEDLSLEIDGSIITISGQRKDTGFSKTFRVNTEQFAMDSVKAGYKNGLLTITLDKVKKAEIEKRTVTIQ